MTGEPGATGGNSKPSHPLPDSGLDIAKPRAIDVCSLVAPKALSSFGDYDTIGKPGEYQYRNSYTICGFDVEPCKQNDTYDEHCQKPTDHEVGNPVSVEVAWKRLSNLKEDGKVYLAPGLPEYPLEKFTELRVDGHVILRSPKSPKACAYLIPIGDFKAFTVYVEPSSDKVRAAKLCAVGKAVVDPAVQRIATGKVEPFDLPDYAFAFLDTCRMLDGIELTVGGVRVHQVWRGDFGRRCSLRSDGVIVRIYVKFGEIRKDWGTEVEVDGRPTWIIDNAPIGDTKDGCEVKTPGTVEGVPEFATVEISYVTDVPPGTDVCEQTRRLAAAIWPALPR